MKKIEIIISGVGGQGCVSAGNILAHAAGVYDGYESLMVSAYGPEARGTFTKAEVIISGNPISFINCLEPNYVIAMDTISYKHYVDELAAGTKFIYNCDTVTPSQSQAEQIPFALTTLALESGSILNMNSIVLGILVAMTGCAKPDSVEQCIIENFSQKPDVALSNVKAFRMGLAAPNTLPSPNETEK